MSAYLERKKNRGGIVWDFEKEDRRATNKGYFASLTPYYKNGIQLVGGSLLGKIEQTKSELKRTEKQMQDTEKEIQDLRKLMSIHSLKLLIFLICYQLKKFKSMVNYKIRLGNGCIQRDM
ncbi:hypothetical protein MOE39_20425 [Bacillus cereus]|uniref:hypothetical protein n=1 Tax=Bacillus cereus TaxID=1396 RepID=UPI0022816557|nr:hypothetical protein [Bacillus cereus]